MGIPPLHRYSYIGGGPRSWTGTMALQNPDVDTRIQNKKGKNKWDKKKFRNKIIDKYKQIVKTLRRRKHPQD